MSNSEVLHGEDLSCMPDEQLERYKKAIEEQLQRRQEEREKFHQVPEDFCEMRRAAIAHSLTELLVDPKFAELKASEILTAYMSWERSIKDFSRTPRYPNDRELLRRMEEEKPDLLFGNPSAHDDIVDAASYHLADKFDRDALDKLVKYGSTVYKAEGI